MTHNLFEGLKKPALYEETKIKFWDDEYISKQMLKAHLDPEFDGASRKMQFIEESVSWIGRLVSPDSFPSLLDIGCGPGIYAERFTQLGFQVTGVDFSKRSIQYAEHAAAEKDLDITYLYKNYLELDLQKKFDFCTLIYCDYGALSELNRKTVMNKVYEHLKPGGKFLLDVFSMSKYNFFEESQTWDYCPDGGFWKKEAYMVLNKNTRFSDCVTLEQIMVISEAEVLPYYLWNTYFTKETLISECVLAGFKVCDVFSDVTGRLYAGSEPTIAVLLQK